MKQPNPATRAPMPLAGPPQLATQVPPRPAIPANPAQTAAQTLRIIQPKDAVAQQRIYAEAVSGLMDIGRTAPPASQAPTALLIASVADGYVGSIYFPEGRIRTTHIDGPKQSAGHVNTLRFNLDRAASEAAFAQANDLETLEEEVYARYDYIEDVAETEEMFEDGMINEKSDWFANVIRETIAEGQPLPAWVSPASDPQGLRALTPDTPHDMQEQVMFELHPPEENEDRSWHISRGAAMQLRLPNRTLTAVKEAVSFAQRGPTALAKNQMFHDYISLNAPDFLPLIRPPSAFESR